MASWSTSGASNMHRRVTHEARPWVERLARLGYAAQGVLYGTIGALAVMAAAKSAGVSDEGGKVTDSKGALTTLAAQPLGKGLLFVMALGLAAYALWRFVQAFMNPEGEAGHDAKGVAKRVGWFVVGSIHVGLAIFALDLALGTPTSGGGGSRGWTAKLMAWDPAGPILVAVAGLAVFGYAVHQVWRAWRADLDRELDLSRVRPQTRRIITGLSRFGVAARGVVFSMMGVFLVVAALTHDAGKARGLGDALQTLQGWTFGTVLLAVVALGLVAYGIYDLVEARYRRIRPA